MKSLDKQYQLWTYSDYGYHLEEFDTLQEILLAPKHTDDWYVTKRVDFQVVETED